LHLALVGSQTNTGANSKGIDLQVVGLADTFGFDERRFRRFAAHRGEHPFGLIDDRPCLWNRFYARLEFVFVVWDDAHRIRDQRPRRHGVTTF
jgi:hypothetical protein